MTGVSHACNARQGGQGQMAQRRGGPVDDKTDNHGVRHTSGEIRHPGLRRNISKSAVRALDVLEHFAAVERPLRATDIAHALDLSPSSADQLLKSMVDAAYLLIDPEGKLYRPSPRLLPFANWLSEGFFGGSALSNSVTAIAARTGQIVTLAAPQMGSLQLVDVATPPALTGLVRKGSRVSITGSALGAAFLSAHEAREIERWIACTPEARHMDEETLAELYASVDAVRQRGYACGLSDHLFSIALALPKPAAGVQLILGLAGRAEHIEPRVSEFYDQMRRYADSLVIS